MSLNQSLPIPMQEKPLYNLAILLVVHKPVAQKTVFTSFSSCEKGINFSRILQYNHLTGIYHKTNHGKKNLFI